jgi:hypothetical protein
MTGHPYEPGNRPLKRVGQNSGHDFDRNARVSTEEQNLALQLDALRSAGCDPIFQDQGVSGSVIEREGLDRPLAMVMVMCCWCGSWTGWAGRSASSSTLSTIPGKGGIDYPEQRRWRV